MALNSTSSRDSNHNLVLKSRQLGYYMRGFEADSDQTFIKCNTNCCALVPTKKETDKLDDI
ncbi:hypothetical protein VIN01S_35280 [Vibrio inusitatus NBRC 102082]|uniref:Uncharacterized protein n=1 Tax=Vibrio inusitatus NBRC 102082 TaxID=1219070 RepID=A0A4Y3I2Q4_9VIBR|nr:hypothetical protein VIN01S_35280 [Vibrio inusitatus NBRC 102082]